MYTIMLANGTTFDMVDSIKKGSVMSEGTYVDSVELNLINTTLGDIKKEFSTPSQVSNFTEIAADKSYRNQYSGFEKLQQIIYDTELSATNNADVFKVILAFTTDAKEAINAFKVTIENIQKVATELQDSQKTITEAISTTNTAVTETTKSVDDVKTTTKKLEESISDLTPNTNVDTMTVEQAIAFRINESKSALAAYLSDHPITSTAHKSVSEQYSVTSEKQQYLAMMIAMASSAKTAGIDFKPSWNAVGKVCEYDWTLEELSQLALEITNYVRPLVSKQQSIEVNLKACTTVAQVKAVVISY